jgi:hypothetical protein
MFANADFDQLLSLGVHAAQDFFEALDRSSEGDAQALTERALWKTAFASLSSPWHCQQLADEVPNLLRERRISSLRRISHKDGLSFGDGLSSVLALLGRPVEPGLLSEEPDWHRHVDTIDALRAHQLLTPTLRGRSRPPKILTLGISMLQYLGEGFGDQVTTSLSFDRSDFSELQRVRAAARQRRAALTLGEIEISKRLRLTIYPDVSTFNDGATVLRGCSPELYPTIRGALRRVSDATLLDFADVMWGRDDTFWPIELSAKHLGISLIRDRSRWVATLIEVADRNARLNTLLSYCADVDPRAAHLAALCRAYDARLLGHRTEQSA